MTTFGLVHGAWHGAWCWERLIPELQILCRNDRAVDPDWSRRVARERLGVEAIELPGGHSPFLSRPAELAARLDALVR